MKKTSPPARPFLALVAVLALALSAAHAGERRLSDDPDSRLSTIPHDAAFHDALVASGIRHIAVRHEGWNETLDSWARIKLEELTGRTKLRGQEPVYTVLSLIYERDAWQGARIFPLEHPRIAELLHHDDKWISALEFADSPHIPELSAALQEAQERSSELDGRVRLLNAVEQARRLGADRPGIIRDVARDLDQSAVRRLLNEPGALDQARSDYRGLRAVVKREKPFLDAGKRLFHRLTVAGALDEQLLVVPDPDDPNTEWLGARDLGSRFGDRGLVASAEGVGLSRRGGTPIQLAGAGLDTALATAFRERNAAGLDRAVEEFLLTVTQSRYYPTDFYRTLKTLYVRHNPYMDAAVVYGIAAILLGLHAFFGTRRWWLAGIVVLCVGLGIHTAAWIARLLLTGYMPVSNMFESIVFATWSAMAIGVGLEFWKRNGPFGLASAVIGFVALLAVMQMPLHETRIHPLRAVLNSIWLNIHVTAMLVSYGAFMVAAAFAIAYLVKHLFARWTGREALWGQSSIIPLDQMELLMYRLVQIGWPILTVGIMLGAVWADTAWGRYWGWDPKETWALITWIVYTIHLHVRMVMGRKGWVSAAVCLLGFVMVMITWLGVSYISWFAGGLHTYASPTG